MWIVFTYIYNSFLIFFIAAHLLVGAIISFGVGVYSGIYLCQNYEIPKINEPSKLWERFVKFTDQYRKPKTSKNKSDRMSILSILTTNTEEEEINSANDANRLSTFSTADSEPDANVEDASVEQTSDQ